MATYYIATTGNDSTGDGSSTTPWLTLAHAYDESSADDTISCGAGTFDWVSDTIISRTIEGASLDDGTPTTIFDGGGVNVLWSYNGSLSISKIMFQNGIRSGFYCNFQPTTSTDNTTTIFDNCVFKDITVYAGNDQTGVIRVHRGDNTVFTMTNCLFYSITHLGTSNSIVLYARSSPGSGASKTLNIYNNTIHLDDGVAGHIIDGLFTTNSTMNIKNNIISNETGYTIDLVASGNGYTYNMDNNCLYNISDLPAGDDNITTDPLFVDPSADIFELQLDSPCISSGTLI